MARFSFLVLAASLVFAGTAFADRSYNNGQVVRAAQHLGNVASQLAYSLDRIRGCTPGLRSLAHKLAYKADDLAHTARYGRTSLTYEYNKVKQACHQLEREIRYSYYLDYQIEVKFQRVTQAKYRLDDAVRYSYRNPGRDDNCRYSGGRLVCYGDDYRGGLFGGRR